MKGCEYMLNIPCTTCHHKYYGDLEIHKLETLLKELKVVIKTPMKGSFHKDWGLNFRCKYGIPCNEFRIKKNKLNMLTSELEPYLITIAKMNIYKNQYMEALNILRGSFPSIYYVMNKIHTGAYNK